MPQINKVGRIATTIGHDGVYHFVKYHRTKVVRWNSDTIVLTTGGWYSPTTVRRMNQASNQFNLGFSVYRRNGAFYVMFAGEVHEFHFFVVLDRLKEWVFISSSGKTYPGNFI